MNFDSLLFFCFIFFSLIAFQLFRQSALRPFVLAIINAIFLISFSSSFKELVPLLCFLFLGYIFINIQSQARNAGHLAIFVSLVIVLFIYLKKYTLVAILPFVHSPYTVIGLSYILFRIIHLLIDTHDKAIDREISPLNYFNYTCFFLNLVSGPIQRYQDFIGQDQRVGRSTLSKEGVFQAFSRIANGYIKITFLAPFFYHNPHPQYLDYAYVFDKLHDRGPIILSGWYIFAALSFTFKLYMNFSGYMDIVIGFGKLFHYKLPENFEHPFSSSNFLEFWSRWHITLAEWFKFYIFNPFLKLLMYRFHSPWMVPYLGAVAYFLTFFIMGVWHGTTAIFFIYGLFLGLGVGINKFYQVFMRNYFGKVKYQHLCANSLYRQLSRCFACSYFCVALTSLWMDLEQFTGLFGKSSLVVLVLGFLGIGIFLTGFLFIWYGLVDCLHFLRKRLRTIIDSFFVSQLWLAVKVLFVSYLILSNINPSPVFIYQAF